MSTSSVKNLKSAIFSALLVLIIAYPVLGLKLTTVGISLEVHGATAFELWCIGGAAALIFVWQLLRDRITPAWAKRPSLPSGGQVAEAPTRFPPRDKVRGPHSPPEKRERERERERERKRMEEERG